MFDQIYVLTLEGSSRESEILDELKRVGLWQTGKVRFHYTVKSPLKEAIVKYSIRNFWMQNRPNLYQPFDCAFNHYEIWNIALQKNQNRVLILEDDARFLKDVDEIFRILEDMPKDADIILFDKFLFGKNIDSSEHYVKYGNDFNGNWTAACYALSNKAMEVLCKKQEEKLQPADELMIRYCNEIPLNRYYCPKNLAIQNYKYQDAGKIRRFSNCTPNHELYQE